MGDGVFGHFVFEEALLEVGVDDFEVTGGELEAFGKADYISEDLLAAVNLGEIVAQLFGGEIMEGPRPHNFA